MDPTRIRDFVLEAWLASQGIKGRAALPAHRRDPATTTRKAHEHQANRCVERARAARVRAGASGPRWSWASGRWRATARSTSWTTCGARDPQFRSAAEVLGSFGEAPPLPPRPNDD